METNKGAKDMPYLNATKIKQEAHLKWVGILARSGIPVEYLRNKHGACPLCGGTDRYRFDDKTVNLTYYCNNCGHGSGLDLLMGYYSYGLHDALSQVHNVLSGTNDPIPISSSSPLPVVVSNEAKQKILEGLIRYTSRTPTQAGIDYWDSRGIKGMQGRRIENIQYGRITYGVYGTIKDSKGDYVKTEAIIGLFSQWNEPPVGALQIYLEEKKLVRYMPDDKTYIRKPLFKVNNLSGSGIWLAGTSKSKVLHVVEGLENAVSIASILNTRHVVATGTAPLMQGLFVPDHVEIMHIWSDNDAAGVEASVRLKERYLNKKIIIHNPSDYHSGSQDWNDLLASSDSSFNRLKA